MARQSDSLALFQPAVRDWFSQSFEKPTAPQAKGWPVIARGEHIHIEAEPGSVAAPTPHRLRKVRTSYVLKSRLRGCETEVSILEDHYVTVRTVRPDAQARKYEFDLRFANPKPLRVRSISWFWLTLAGSMIA